MNTQFSKNNIQKLYDRDFNLWLEATANQLKARQVDELDWQHLIEEIESLGRADKRELKSRLIVLLEHLLKLAYWQEARKFSSRGWQDTIREQRRQIKLLLSDSPSLQPFLLEVLPDCYADAREDTLAKTGLPIDTLPTESPFNFDEVIDLEYLPVTLETETDEPF